jgi:hypothetical protein
MGELECSPVTFHFEPMPANFHEGPGPGHQPLDYDRSHAFCEGRSKRPASATERQDRPTVHGRGG